MKQIVYIENYLDDPFTTSKVVAEWTDNKHESVTRLIRKHSKSLENFGKVGFEIRASESGQSQKIYFLSEPQVTLLITFMQNTPNVVAFKVELVKQFYEMRNEILSFKIQRALEQPIRADLTNAIKNWEHSSPWAYKNVTDLLFKLTTGKNAKLLKEIYNTPTALDTLSAEELREYQRLESIAIKLIEANFSYKGLKETLQRMTPLQLTN